MRKYLYLVLALVGLGLILAIPSHAVENSLVVTQKDITGVFVAPQQWDILVSDFTLKPASNDVLQVLTVGNQGLAPYTYIQEVRLYADDGDGVFQGWQRDVDLGLGTVVPNYMSQYMWYWQDLNVDVPSAGKQFFIAVKVAKNNVITSDRKTIQMNLLSLHDQNSDGVFNLLTDAGIYMASKNNGPQSDMTSSGIYTIAKTSWDSLAPVSVIKNPTANQQLTSKQVLISGYTKDQGEGYLDRVVLTIKDDQDTILVDKVQANVTELDTGKWEYAYTFLADGKYTVISQGIDGVANLETPGDSVTFNIGTTVTPPPVVPPVTPPTEKSYTYGDLIKASGATVYYFGQDGKRYVFPTLATYKTWYPDFLTVKTTTDLDLGTVTIGGNVTYRPGVKLVKITTDPKVYAVGANGTLRWITTEALAISLYGANWGNLVEDVPDPFFVNYSVGAPITNTADFSPAGVTSGATSINVDKGL